MRAPVIREAAAASSAVDAQPDQPSMPMAVPLGEERQQRQPPNFMQVASAAAGRAQCDIAVLHARLVAIRSGLLEKKPSIVPKDAEAYFTDLTRGDNKQQLKGTAWLAASQ